MKIIKLPKGLTIQDNWFDIGEIFESDGSLSVVLYQTEIVNFKSSYLTLRSGGWQTNHTKKCINLILSHYKLGISLKQVEGKWFVLNEDGRNVPFQDGMRISI